MTMFKQFCQECKDDAAYEDFYKCKELSLSLFNDNIDIMKTQYSSTWHDFVSLRLTLLYGDLKRLFLDLGCSINDINHFYSYCKFYRTQCILFPICSSRLFTESFNEYKDICKYFGEKDSNYCHSIESIDPILVYFVIYNGIYELLTKYCRINGRDQYGFDAAIINIDDVKDISQVGDVLKIYMFDQFCQSNLFCKTKSYITSVKFCKGEARYLNEHPENEPHMKNMKKVLFDFVDTNGNGNNNKIDNSASSMNQFLSFLKQSVQDISNICKYRSNYHNYKYHQSANDDTRDYGFTNLITNRVAFLVFHDLSKLMFGSNNKEKEKKREKEMFYPLLTKMYKFLWNFCVYFHCYPSPQFDDDKKHEGHYLTQYFEFRKCLFVNVFNGSDFVYDAILQNFNYYDYEKHYGTDGTLLHTVFSNDYNLYSEVLINKDNFDCYKKGRPDKKGNSRTPNWVANHHHNLVITGIMKVELAVFL